jgi:hypothetical protein
MSGIPISHVHQPESMSSPPTISRHATKAAVKRSSGIPSFVKRPIPWFAQTNFRMPSQKKTPPAINRKAIVDFGP